LSDGMQRTDWIMEHRRTVLGGLLGGAVLGVATGPRAWAQAPFQSNRIKVETRGEGPDLILIPGLASTPAVWQRTIGRLGQGRRLHLVSVRGFGDLPAGDNARGALMPGIAAEVQRYMV